MSCKRPITLTLLGLLACACRPAPPDSPTQPQDDETQSSDASRDAVNVIDDAAVDSPVESEQDAGKQDVAAPADAATPVDDGIPSAPNVFPLVAPSLCTTQHGRMFECLYERGRVDAPSMPDTGEFKTRVTGHSKGDCSTQFAFIARLSGEGVAPFNYNIFENDEVWLRRDDSAAISSVTIEDGSAFAGKPNYHASCRAWLEVEFNVPIQPSSSAM